MSEELCMKLEEAFSRRMEKAEGSIKAMWVMLKALQDLAMLLAETRGDNMPVDTEDTPVSLEVKP